MILPSVILRGILLIAVCVPILGSRSTDSRYNDFPDKRIYLTTAAGGEDGDEEQYSQLKDTNTSEDPDEVYTFDSKRKSSTIKPNYSDSVTYSSTYFSRLTTNPKESREKLNKSLKDEARNGGELLTKGTTLNYKDDVSDSRPYDASLTTTRTYKRFEYSNDEVTLTTPVPRENKFVSDFPTNQYSSINIDHNNDKPNGGRDNDEYESQSTSTRNPTENKNFEWKNNEIKKKVNKKESTVDHVETVDKSISTKNDKTSKDGAFKAEKLHVKNSQLRLTTSATYPEALDNHHSTINISVIDNDKAVKNISVNNESGSNLLEVESLSSEVLSSRKVESDIPHSDSVINKNSVTAENLDILNKTPTIKYVNKQTVQNNLNINSSVFNSRHDASAFNVGPSTTESSGYEQLKIEEFKNTIPVVNVEPSTEPTLKLLTKPIKVPENDVSNQNISTNENNNDIKKITSFTIPHFTVTPSLSLNGTGSIRSFETKTTTPASSVPRLSIDFKNRINLSSTVRTKTLPTSDTSTVRYSLRTLPSTAESSNKAVDSLPFSGSNNDTSSEIDEQNAVTTTTTESNELKKLPSISSRKRPVKLNFLTSTSATVTPIEMNTTINPTTANNNSYVTHRPSRRPSSFENGFFNTNRTSNRSTTESTTRIKPFVSWATRLQKINSVISTTIQMPTTTMDDFEADTTDSVTNLSSESSSTTLSNYKTVGGESDTTNVEDITSNPLSSVYENLTTPSMTPSTEPSPPTSTDKNGYSENHFSTSESLPDFTAQNYSETDTKLESVTQSLPSSSYNMDTTIENIWSSISMSSSGFSSSTIDSHSTSEVTESVTPIVTSNVSYITETSDSTSGKLSTVDESTVSGSSPYSVPDSMFTPTLVDYTDENTTESGSTVDYYSSTSQMDFVSSSTTPDYSVENNSATSAINDVYSSTSESIFVPTSIIPDLKFENATASSVVDNNLSTSTEFSSSGISDLLFTNSTKYPSFTEESSDFSSTSLPSSHSYSTSSNYLVYGNNTFTEESVKPKLNFSDSLFETTAEITTIPVTTAHDFDDSEEDGFSDHSNKVHQHSSTVLPTEHSIFSSVSPAYSESDTEIDDEDDKNKNESYFTDGHHIKHDDLTTESSKIKTTESTTLNALDTTTSRNKTHKTSSQLQNLESSTLMSDTNKTSGEQTLVTTSKTKVTATTLNDISEEGVSVIQTTMSTKEYTKPSSPNWTINNVPEYLQLRIDATWREMCQSEETLKKVIKGFFKNGTGRNLRSSQIKFLNLTPEQCSQQLRNSRTPILVDMTFLDETGSGISSSLNKDFMRLFKHKRMDGELRVQDVQLLHSRQKEMIPEEGNNAIEEMNNSTAIAAIVISCVAVVCLLLLGILLVILRKRQKGFSYGQRCTPVSLDDYSLDNISVSNSMRRKNANRASKRSYGNPAFDDPNAVSHSLNFAGLSNFCSNRKAIDEEFSQIPLVSAKMDELPTGAETKNRYANVIPLPETRVHLSGSEGAEASSDYINANYVKGPKGVDKFYIACQAPMQSTVNDFWKMIWEQQCKIILMLTDLYENGVEKCYDYLPPSEVLDCHRRFGDYIVTLKNREVREKYVINSLQLKNLETNLWREVTHLWYMSWPHQGVPDEGTSIIAFLIEARSYMRNTSPHPGPHVVHCSPGTGRTGTVLAIDLCIRDFETNRSVDIPKTVYALRRDRAGAVQTKDQYAFIYQVLNIYAAKLTGGALDSI